LETSWQLGLATSFQLIRLVGCGLYEACVNRFTAERMNVGFRYVLEHLSRIARVLRIPGGHVLLVGVGGSGRQSLTKLAAALSLMSVFQPEISKNYGINEWREDLKVECHTGLVM